MRKLGRYVEYGVFGSDVTVDWSIISDDKELDVLGAHLGPYCWPAAIKMIESGVLPMDEICTHQLPLTEFQKGLDLVASGKESVKVSLIPAVRLEGHADDESHSVETPGRRCRGETCWRPWALPGRRRPACPC